MNVCVITVITAKPIATVDAYLTIIEYLNGDNLFALLNANRKS